MRVEYHIHDGLGWVTLCNPPLNLLDQPAVGSRDSLAAFLADATLRAVMVRGQGRHFCAGADRQAMGALRRDPRFGDGVKQGRAWLDALRSAPVPVLALIRGSCLGAGLEIATACLFRLASENALLGSRDEESGPLFGGGGHVSPNSAEAPRLTRLVGAEEAKSLGLVDGVVPTRSLEAAGRNFVNRLTAHRSPELIRRVMESIHNGYRLPMRDALMRETDLFREAVRSAGWAWNGAAEATD
jgi:enoyl-CoA hydratase/carnithine racemase